MMIHVLDKNYELQCDIPFNLLTDDELHRILKDGSATYNFSIPSSHEDANLIVNEGYAVIPAPLPDTGYLELIIKTADTKDGIKTVNTTQSVSSDLNKDYIRPVTFTDKTAKEMLSSILIGTGWEPGFIESTGVQTLSINDYPTKMSGVQSIKDTFGLEVKFRVEWDGNQVIGRYVDMLNQVGKDTGKEFEYARDLQGLELIQSSFETYGGVVGLGATDENGNYLTFKDVSRAVGNGDKFDKPAGQDYIIHPTASKDYSAIGKYVNTDITDPEELADKAWEWLLDQISIKETFNADVALLSEIAGYEQEAVAMGDTVGIKNKKFNPSLMLKARIFDLTQSFVDPSKDKAILGDYRRVQASPNALIKQLQSKLHYTTGVASGASMAAKAAQQAADDAQTAAENAQTDADTANELLSDISSDSKLTPSEKQTTKQEWDIISAEKATIDGQADTYSITTEKTNYDNAYTTLSTYITPLLADLTTTSDIVGTDFRAKFKAYYDTRTTLLKKVTDAAKQAVEDVQVGGRNLVLDSDVYISNTSYPTHVYTMSEDMISGQTYTIRLKGTLGAGKSYFGVYLNGGSIFLDYLTDNGDGTYSITFAGKSDSSEEPNVIHIYPLYASVTATSTIEWIKLEKGNKATDWTPAPEDVDANIDQAEQNAKDYTDQSAVIIDQSYNGAGFSNADGLFSNRSDDLVRIIGNADVGFAIQRRSVNTDPWTNVLYFDTYGNVKYIGELDGASGTFAGDLTSYQIYLGDDTTSIGEGSINFKINEDFNNDGVVNLFKILGMVVEHPDLNTAPTMFKIGLRDFHLDAQGYPIIDPTYSDIDELDLYAKLLSLTGDLKIDGKINTSGTGVWIAATLTNGFSNYGNSYNNASYMKDPFGFVHLQGLVNMGSVGQSTPMFILPVGYRPTGNKSYSVWHNGGVKMARIFIEATTGKVSVIDTSDANAAGLISLDDIPPFYAGV